MAKRGGRSGRKYVRDNRGRFATTGATARGGRLKTKSGKKRATQTVKAKTGSKPAGAIKGKIKRDPGAAKPAVAKTKLKRSGEKIGVNSLKTNKEQGRKGIASMSSRAKAARKGDVAERKSRRMSRIAERQSEIVARRQGRRASNYNPDGTFNQSTANANQRRLGRSKQLQEKLSYAGGGKNIASKALSKRRKAKPAAAKRRGAVGKISEAKAGRIVARMDAQRGRKAMPGRRNENFSRTYERSRQFILKPAATARKKGKPISVNESVQKAVANAAKRRKPKPAAAKPAAAKALKGIKKEVGYKAPRSLRKGVKQTPVKRPTVNSAKRAPDNARTRANRLKTTQAKVKYLRVEPDSSAFKSAVKQRDAALKARPAGTAGKVTFRSKARAASRFQQRANDVTGRVRMDIKYDKTKSLRATGGGGGKGARVRDTGASQTSLFGKPAPLRRASKVSVIKRRTGKRRFS